MSGDVLFGDPILEEATDVTEGRLVNELDIQFPESSALPLPDLFYTIDDDVGDKTLDEPPDCLPEPEIQEPLQNVLQEQSVDNNSSNIHDNDNCKSKRNSRATPEKWKQNQLTYKRLKGEKYNSKSGKENSEKKMGAKCVSAYCAKSEKRKCNLITQQDRQAVFDLFWSLESWKERRRYINTLVQKTEVNEKRANLDSRRKNSFKYMIKRVDGSALNVCKSMFASTFGLPERTIMHWVKVSSYSPGKHGPVTGKCVKVTKTQDSFLDQWLQGVPTVDSHYCRSSPTYKNKRFIYPGGSIAALYREYKVEAEKSGQRVLSQAYFNEAFHKQNMSVFIPRKDQCDTCISYKHGQISKTAHEEHLKQKELARNEKKQDKEQCKSDENISAWTMDLQAVLLCPKTKASSMYYKTKLQLHNFTLYNLNTKDGYCYTWNETEGDLSSEVFAYLQYKHFESVLKNQPHLKKIIIWSDGCGYQNRNVKVANMYSHLACEYNVDIVQKYLVSGHTQMECDSMHSTIERKLNIDLYTERDYVVAMKCARIKPKPYAVETVKSHQFKHLKDLYFSSIRPGKKVGDPKVHDLKAIYYSNNGLVHLKLGFDQDWFILPHRTSTSRLFSWQNLFPQKLPIKSRKYQDLQSMKSVIPQDCHAFYDSLPHL